MTSECIEIRSPVAAPNPKGALNRHSKGADRCAYCGVSRHEKRLTKDHVPPKGLFPSTVRSLNVQLITVPACGNCNNDASDDEAHFRYVLSICGDRPNASLTELWNESILRSLEQPDNRRRATDLFATVFVDGQKGMCSPKQIAQDNRITSVVRKIVRGLCYHHNVHSPKADEQIKISPPIFYLTTEPEYWDGLSGEHTVLAPDVFEYRFGHLQEDVLTSWWGLSFFQTTTFMAYLARDLAVL